MKPHLQTLGPSANISCLSSVPTSTLSPTAIPVIRRQMALPVDYIYTEELNKRVAKLIKG